MTNDLNVLTSERLQVLVDVILESGFVTGDEHTYDELTSMDVYVSIGHLQTYLPVTPEVIEALQRFIAEVEEINA